MEKIVNIKCNGRHATLESEIKKFQAIDISRADMLKDALNLAKEVKDWYHIYLYLESISIPTSKREARYTFQAKIDEDTEKLMTEISEKMASDLKRQGIISKTLQNQFLLLMLLSNYHLEATKKAISTRRNTEEDISEKELTLPEMASLFTEMMLTDRECVELTKIEKILIDWRKKHALL